MSLVTATLGSLLSNRPWPITQQGRWKTEGNR